MQRQVMASQDGKMGRAICYLGLTDLIYQHAKCAPLDWEDLQTHHPFHIILNVFYRIRIPDDQELAVLPSTSPFLIYTPTHPPTLQTLTTHSLILDPSRIHNTNIPTTPTSPLSPQIIRKPRPRNKHPRTTKKLLTLITTPTDILRRQDITAHTGYVKVCDAERVVLAG